MSVQVEASTVTVCVATSRSLDGYIDHLLLFVVPSSFKGKLETIYYSYTASQFDVIY